MYLSRQADVPPKRFPSKICDKTPAGHVLLAQNMQDTTETSIASRRWTQTPPLGGAPPSTSALPEASQVPAFPRADARGAPHTLAHPPPRRATMEGTGMMAAQESQALAGASLPVGEPVTLVIEE